MGKKTVLQLILLLGFLLQSYAQPSNVGFERYTLEQGLSHTTVYTILQDDMGYIWLGTKEGLNRFDGYQFTAYEYELNDSTTLSGTSVYSIFFDKKGRFWVGTNEGLNLFDRYTHKATRIPHGVTDGSGTSNSTIWSIAEDKAGNIYLATNKGLEYWNSKTQRFESVKHPDIWKGKIYFVSVGPDNRVWLGTAKGGLQIFDPKKKTVQTFNSKNGLSGNEVRGILKDSKGRVWVSSRKALHIFDEKEKSFEYFSPKKGNLPARNTNTILEDNEGIIWVGTWGTGLNLFLEKENRFVAFKNDPRNDASLSDNFVNSIYEDKSGAIWVATSGGVSRYDKNRKHFVTYQNEVGVDNSLSSSIINNVIRDRKGQLWVATKTGGINLWDEDRQGFVHFRRNKKDPTSLLSNRTNRMSEALDGKIWIATNKGVSVLNPKNEKFRNYTPNESTYFTAPYIQTVLCDSAGNVWVGTVAGLDKYVGEKSPYFEPVTLLKNGNSQRDKFLINNIIEGEDGKLWIGTFGKGLLHFDPKTGDVKSYVHDGTKNSISNNHIYYIHIDGDIIWIGTNGSGLDRFDTKTGVFENFSSENGLPNNVINGIESDKNGMLWVSTNKGVFRLNKKTKAIKVYDADYGLQSNLFRRRASWCDPDGRIYFGGLQGLTAFYPDEISDNPVKPVVHVRKMQVFDKTEKNKLFRINTSTTKPIVLKHSQNNFLVDFIGVSYYLSKRNRYKYQLIGFDNSWREAGSRRQAEYTNVPPGDYIFQAIAANSDGVWNEEGDSVQITILPPWWQTWWAIVLEIVGTIALVVGIVKWRTRYYKKQKEQLENLVKARTFELFESHEELRAQRDELQQQTNMLEKQSRQITDSINYAERMQRALLKSGEQVRNFFPESFIFFQPRGIVSGDFYWSGKIGSKFAIVAADCTGHGVPGAILSVLGIAFFNEIVAMNKDLSAGEVLDILREKIKRIFKGSNTSHIVSDGMDLAMCMINPEKTVLEYAGAYNPLFMIRDGELEKFKADIMPIGYYVREQSRFTTRKIELQKGDKFYMFSDGFVDQFGGKNGHKFMMKNFRKLLLSIHQKEMKEQGKILQETIDKYRGSQIQVDDILVMGFHVDEIGLSFYPYDQ